MHIECINKKAMHGDRSYCVLILNEVGTGWLCSVYGFYHLLITNNVIIPIIFFFYKKTTIYNGKKMYFKLSGHFVAYYIVSNYFIQIFGVE